MNKTVQFAKSSTPPTAASLLAKVLGRMGRLLNNYSGLALRECGVSSFEDFFYLNDIGSNHLLKKTELIYANFHEISSGLLIIGRLRIAGLILEVSDSQDKRIKRLKLTGKGEKVLKNCFQKLEFINKVFFSEMTENEINICTQFLSPTEQKFSLKWISDKRKSLSEFIDKAKG